MYWDLYRAAPEPERRDMDDRKAAALLAVSSSVEHTSERAQQYERLRERGAAAAHHYDVRPFDEADVISEDTPVGNSAYVDNNDQTMSSDAGQLKEPQTQSGGSPSGHDELHMLHYEGSGDCDADYTDHLHRINRIPYQWLDSADKRVTERTASENEFEKHAPYQQV